MTKARRTVAGIVAATAAAASLALPLVPSGATGADLTGYDYVTVSNNGGVVHVGTGIPGQPLVGASVDTNTGKVCVGFSYQVPFCTFDGGWSSTLGASSAIPSPVWVDADPSDGYIGAGVRIGTGSIVAVWYSTTSGALCATVGISRPICAQLT